MPEGVIIIMEMIMEMIIIMNALRQTPDTAKLPALPDAGLKKAKVLFVSFFMAQKKTLCRLSQQRVLKNSFSLILNNSERHRRK